MAVTPGNILVGIGSLLIDAVDVGATFDGINIAKTLEHFFHEVDQILDAVDATPTNMQMQVTTNIVEATLVNLRTVWNERSGPVAGVLKLGINPDKAEHNIRFEGRKPGPGAIGSRQYELFRGFFVDEVAHSLKRDDKVMFPVTIRCLPDTAKATGEEYGLVTDV